MLNETERRINKSIRKKRLREFKNKILYNKLTSRIRRVTELLLFIIIGVPCVIFMLITDREFRKEMRKI